MEPEVRYHRVPVKDIRRSLARFVFGAIDVSPNEVNYEETPLGEALAMDVDDLRQLRDDERQPDTRPD